MAYLDNADYFLRREQAELDRACHAESNAVKSIHRHLAELYAELALVAARTPHWGRSGL